MNSSFDRVARYNYDSWGNVLSIVNNQGEEINNKNDVAYINHYRYRSYYYEETQLYYLNNRHYNPKWGRFLSPDAMIGSNNSIIGNNLYAYAGNDPVNNIDDTGINFLKKAINVVKNVGKAILNIGKTIINASGFTSNVSACIEEIDTETKGVIISGSIGRRANVSISSNKQDKPITIYSETNNGNLLDTALGVKTEIENANIDTKLSASDTSITFVSYSNNKKMIHR